jgi:hypothetical protein
MRFAYLTLDVVNENLAARLAAAAGLSFRTLTLRDPVPDGRGDVVLYDLDFLPADYRERLLADLKSGRWSGRVGVHSYSLTRRLARALRRRGVVVTRRLRGGLFRRLRDRAGVASLQSASGKSPPT